MRDTAAEGSAPLPPKLPLLRAPLAPSAGRQLGRPRGAGPGQEPAGPPHARPEAVPTRPRPGCPAGERRGTSWAPLCPSAPGPLARRVALARACAAAAAAGEGPPRALGPRGDPRRPVPSPPSRPVPPRPAGCAAAPDPGAAPAPQGRARPPRGPPRPPPRPRPPPALPAPPARRGPRKAGQRARSPQQEILAGLGAAEGAAAPGSGGSGIIFYQRRDQLPHPVTGPYTKAQTDLEKLGRPAGGEGETGRGDGALPCCRPGRRRRDNNQGRRRPPLIGAQKPHTKVPAAPGGGTRRAERRGGAPRRRAAPPPARAPARGGAGRPRAALRGAPGTYHGAQVLSYYTNIPDKRGSAEGYGLGAACRACAAARGKAGKRALEGPAMFRPASRPAGGGGQGRALPGWPPARSPRPAPAGGGEPSAGAEASPGAAEERGAARRPPRGSSLPRGGGGCASRLVAAGAPIVLPGEGAPLSEDSAALPRLPWVGLSAPLGILEVGFDTDGSSKTILSRCCSVRELWPSVPNWRWTDIPAPEVLLPVLFQQCKKVVLTFSPKLFQVANLVPA